MWLMNLPIELLSAKFKQFIVVELYVEFADYLRSSDDDSLRISSIFSSGFRHDYKSRCFGIDDCSFYWLFIGFALLSIW